MEPYLDPSASQRLTRSRKRQEGVRDLNEILRNAESSRVLNLSSVFAEWREFDEYKESPFFENRVLNRAIIMKHAVQHSDTYNYRKTSRRATKLIFPLDRNDLSLGGMFAFVGQKNFSAVLARHFSGHPLSERDERVLQMLHDLPTLDPFLLYSLLKANDIQVSELYFQLSEHDRWKIQREMTAEFVPLISLCFPGADVESDKVKLFIDKILNFADGEEIEALRQAFDLSKEDFAMAMFAWRGIIYYKWRCAALQAKLVEVTARLTRIRVADQGGKLSLRLLELSRTKIANMAVAAGDRVVKTIARYDNAYGHFVQDQEVEKFRLFLKSAPGLFMNCGQSVAIMEHIINFFEFRTGRLLDGVMSSFDFAKMLTDLELELGLDFQVKLRIW
jgi:hypothetical protein